MPAPIWKDYEVSFGNVAEADYTIWNGEALIFSGHAVRRPDAAQLTVRINDVCADYLAHTLPGISSRAAVNDPCCKTFTVKDGGGSTVGSVEFIADWSYDPDHVATLLAAPVNGRVSAAQTLVASVASSSAVAVVFTYADGTTSSASVTSAGGPVQAVSVPLAGISDLVKVTVGGIVYDVVPGCARYALMYVNAFGGWDTLLMEGRDAKADNYDRHRMEQRYNNSVRSERGLVEYANEVTRRWTLRTGWLRDAQSARMHHLLGSAHVWLYDIEAGDLQPVVVTETECDYKTYRGNGGKLTGYTVTVELAQSMTRR